MGHRGNNDDDAKCTNYKLLQASMLETCRHIRPMYAISIIHFINMGISRNNGFKMNEIELVSLSLCATCNSME